MDDDNKKKPKKTKNMGDENKKKHKSTNSTGDEDEESPEPYSKTLDQLVNDITDAASRITIQKLVKKIVKHPETVSIPLRPSSLYDPRNLSRQEIWDGTTAENWLELVGFGGPYGFLSEHFLSKKCLVESDHFPPDSAYEHAKDEKIKKIKSRDRAALTVPYEFHRKFFTTGNNPDSLKEMAYMFHIGDYYGAIDKSIKMYVKNPKKVTYTERENLVYFLLMEGIINGLDVHVKNGLITEEEKNRLIEEHGLAGWSESEVNRIYSAEPRRWSARHHITERFRTLNIQNTAQALRFTGAGTGAGNDARSLFGTKTRTRTDANAGTRTKTGSGTGTGAGNGARTQTGTGTQTGSGTSAGSGTRTGTGSETGTGTGNFARSGTGTTTLTKLTKTGMPCPKCGQIHGSRNNESNCAIF